MVLQAEHDYAVWRMGEILWELKGPPRTPLEVMVDEATGAEDARVAGLAAEVSELTAVVDEYRREAGLPPIPTPEGAGQ